MKNRLTQIVCISLCIVFLLCGVPSAFAATETKLKVGYIPLQGFLYQDQDGDFSGFAYEMFHEIAMYCDWDYEFYACAYSDVERLFDSGELDLFVPYQKATDGELPFECSHEVFCTDRVTLQALPTSPIDYNDWADLDGCTVGELSGTRNGERFRAALAEKGCRITLKSDYTSRDALLADAKSGQIDAFISVSNRGITNFKIVAELPQTSSFVIAPKGKTELLGQIDDAIQAIHIEEPAFIPTLEIKYQATENGRYPSLSEEENAYIRQRGTVTVLISQRECDDQGSFTGSAKLLFDSLHSLTGLTFTPVVEESITQIMADIQTGKADLVYTFNRDYDWARQHNVWMTQSYSSFYNKIVKASIAAEVHSVGIVPGSYTEYWVGKNTSYTTKAYATYKECIDAVQNGEVDATYCSSPIGSYYSTFPQYARLSFLNAYEYSADYCIGVSKQSDHILLDILNKGLLCIPSGYLNTVFEEQLSARPISLIDFFYRKPAESVAIIAFAVAVLLALAFACFYTVRVKKKNKQLAAANGAKTEFYSRMSHDLRTPMNGILGISELSEGETDLSVMRENMRKIHESGQYLLGLINDTLDLQRMENGKLPLEPQVVSTRDLIFSSTDMIRQMAEEKNIQFRVVNNNANLDGYVRVDPVRMKQIFMNLLSNAVKFTPEGGTVELGFTVLGRKGNIVHDQITVTDTGYGMSEDFIRNKIFQPFSQEHNKLTDTYAGSGLGLSIVKSLVDRMGATIAVESELGVGTKFAIEIDFECVDEIRAEQANDTKEAHLHRTMEQLKGKTILMAEDHPLNAEIATRLLNKAGCSVVWAHNGQECVDLFRASKARQYDAILMDIRMPVTDGLEAARMIRASEHPDAKRIPMIAMTANAYEVDVKASAQAGMNAHLAKPIVPQKLYQTLHDFICERGERDE